VFRTALAQHFGHRCGDIARPAFGGVKGNDTDRIDVLAVEQILDQGFEIGIMDIGLAPRLAGFELSAWGPRKQGSVE
jgi:hypothetical protein